MPAKKATTAAAVSKPTYAVMVTESIKALGARGGSSIPAISKHLQAKYGAGVNKPALLKAIKKGVEAGDYVQIKASYKLNKKTPTTVAPKLRKAPVRKKPAAKPAPKKVVPAAKKPTPKPKKTITKTVTKKVTPKKTTTSTSTTTKKAAPTKRVVQKKATTTTTTTKKSTPKK